jgi:hypothetical protein
LQIFVAGHAALLVVTIQQATFELLKSPEGKEQNKTVLYFNGAKKSLPLNVTNWDSCAEICGDDTDNWPGNKIELYPARTQMGGKTLDCIRIRPPTRKAMVLKAKKPVEPEPEVDEEVEVDEDPDDSIPF